MSRAAARQRYVCWNIRAGGGRRGDAILRQLLRWSADTIGLCEFRGTAASQQLAHALADAGYRHQLSSVNSDCPARNALLLASRVPLTRLRAAGMPQHRERWLLARQQGSAELVVGLMHVPNYTTPELKYPFLDAVLEMTARWRRGPALLLGDTNCGKRLLDEEQPQGNKFAREHDWLVALEQSGWRDVFRHLRGQRREFTWYSHRNNGFRLDYAFANPPLLPALVRLRHAWGRDAAAAQRRDGLSDHAAVIVDIDGERL